ncbi:MAG: dihydroneopterin aldolase [Bacteroidales bacterium]
MKSKITLSGMEFYAYHGCFKEEKIIGTHFKVDAILYCDLLEAAQHDDLSTTVNYQKVYACIKKIMSQPANILESLCYRILHAIKAEFPLISHAEITVYKLNPSIGGKTDSVSVTISDTEK